MPSFVTSLRCLRCGRLHAPERDVFVCDCRPNVGSDTGTLDVLYDFEAIRKAVTPEQLVADTDRSIGRYWPLLPLARRDSLSPLPVGGTPLLPASRLGARLGLPRLYIKDDGRNPTASLKDRASALAVARAREEERPTVATASTGNAAAALAGQCAAAGLSSVIFVPRTAPAAKIAQLLVYGSTVLAISGSYDQAFDLCIEACREFGWYNRNTGFNPYMTEGKKTVAFEIAEQLGAAALEPGAAVPFRAPDAVFVPVGDGCILGGVHKGFQELLALGWIDAMPRLFGVQSTASAALHDAWRDGKDVPVPVRATTRADSIGVDAPRDALKALRAVRDTGGAFVTVSDEVILQSIPELARQAAVFAEPAGASALAGLTRALEQGLVGAKDTVVLLNTGSGLKDVGAAMQVTGGPVELAPTLPAVREALTRR